MAQLTPQVLIQRWQCNEDDGQRSFVTLVRVSREARVRGSCEGESGSEEAKIGTWQSLLWHGENGGHLEVERMGKRTQDAVGRA